MCKLIEILKDFHHCISFMYFIFLQNCIILAQAAVCSFILNHLLYAVHLYNGLNSDPIEINDKMDPAFWVVQILPIIFSVFNLILSLAMDEPLQAHW